MKPVVWIGLGALAVGGLVYALTRPQTAAAPPPAAGHQIAAGDTVTLKDAPSVTVLIESVTSGYYVGIIQTSNDAKYVVGQALALQPAQVA